MTGAELQLFALGASRPYGERIARHLAVELAAHEERDFEDGEHKARPLENVRGRDVYVVHSLHGDGEQSANDKLCRLLFFIGALKDASAASVTAITPYLAYARKDRKTKSRDPVTTRYVAALFEAVGCDRVVTIDVHNLAAFQNAFRCSAENLEAKTLFVDHFAPMAAETPLIVISPDVGGVKRAKAFRDALAARLDRPVDVGFMEKQRSAGVVSGDILVGAVEGCTAIIIDDLISTGTTMARAARACRERGALAVHAAATHGVFTDAANAVIADPAVDSFVVTDTLPPLRLKPELVEKRLKIIDASWLFAEAIRRIHTGGSIVELLGG